MLRLPSLESVPPARLIRPSDNPAMCTRFMFFAFQRFFGLGPLAGCLALAVAAPAQASVVYRCPGNPVLYTDALTAKEAEKKGCAALEGVPVAVPSPRPRAAAAVPAGPATPSPVAVQARVAPAEQKARDLDRRSILLTELQREEAALRSLLSDFKGGEPERRADERNYQKYLDRVAEMKAAIARKEGDIAALKREIAKLPNP
jgi:hypothetical protein